MSLPGQFADGKENLLLHDLPPDQDIRFTEAGGVVSLRWSEYRFYTVGHAGHIERPSKVFLFLCDAQAVRHAERVVEDFDIEVWQGARFVAITHANEMA